MVHLKKSETVCCLVLPSERALSDWAKPTGRPVSLLLTATSQVLELARKLAMS